MAKVSSKGVLGGSIMDDLGGSIMDDDSQQ